MNTIKSYIIISIYIKFRKLNDHDLLDELERYLICHKIPLSSKKSSINTLYSIVEIAIKKTTST